MKLNITFGKIFAVFTLAVFLSGIFSPLAAALTDEQRRAFLSGINYFDPVTSSSSCSVGTQPPAANTSAQLGLANVASKYKLQSVMVKQLGGQVVDSYKANDPPAGVASVFKLIIADVFLSTKPNLDKSVKVLPAEVYSGSGSGTVENPKAGDSITLRQALQMTLMKSSDTDANVLITASGGIATADSIAQKLGYKSSSLASYYHDPAPAQHNSTTVTDLTEAMDNIFSQSSDDYKTAQESLVNDQYNFGLSSYANKWGGTKTVTGNSAIFDINGNKYIITMYSENPWSDSLPGYSASTSDSVGYIKDASNAIVNSLKSISAPPASTTAAACQPASCGGASSSLDRLLQAIAFHESGGDPKVHNSAGGAYGKYQYIDTTWQGAAASFYPPAKIYAHASDAPETIQDMVTYYRFAALASKYNGSVWKMAVVQYYPAALDDLGTWMDKIPAPEAGNTQTIRVFANQIVNWVNSGDGKEIKMTYSQAPDFNKYLQTNGLGNVPPLFSAPDNGEGGPVSSDTQTAFGCSGAAAITQTALALSWPDSSHGLTPKPDYQEALNKYNKGLPAADCGVFVATVMKASGADPDYPASGTTEQAKYVQNNPRYNISSSVASLSDLQAGDILILAGTAGNASSGHTFIYVGPQAGGFNEASASYQERAANLGNTVLKDARGNYMRARLVQ